MSNLIKYPFVNMQGKEVRVIHYESEDEKFEPLEHKKKVIMRSLEEVEEEKKHAAAGTFEEVMPVTNFDEIFQQKSEEAQKEADAILKKATADAEAMLQEARSQVDDLREDARQEGIEMGREEGIRQGQEEIDRMRAEMESERLDRKQEYDEMIRQTEGRYVDVLCSLLRKLSGEIVSDKRDVILHLIRSGIADMEPAKHYIIRVGNEDLLYVESKKDDIVERTGISATVEIQEEKDLERGECIIETDTQMIDCGFHTQLENLITTLRMLVQ